LHSIVVLTSVPQDCTVDFRYVKSDFSPVDEHGRRVPVDHCLVFVARRLVDEGAPLPSLLIIY